jgi:hypothetical protein
MHPTLLRLTRRIADNHRASCLVLEMLIGRVQNWLGYSMTPCLPVVDNENRCSKSGTANKVHLSHSLVPKVATTRVESLDSQAAADSAPCRGCQRQPRNHR